MRKTSFYIFRGALGRVSKTRGLTLLEVTIASGALATSILGAISFYATSERFSLITREESIAVYAAQKAINEIRALPFSTSDENQLIVADYDKETRPVNLYGPEGSNQRLSMGDLEARPGASAGDGMKVTDELGILMINEEAPLESNFGDTKEVGGGAPDGDIDFPIDLNRNGRNSDQLTSADVGESFPRNLGGETKGIDAGAIPVSLLQLVPVVIVVRWQSMAGLERNLQVLTFITDRSGRF